MIDLPPGWSQRGALPSFDPASERDPDKFFALDEDLWVAESADGRYRLDVGWYPEGDERGAFTCVLLDRDDWSRPRFRERTTQLRKVRQWIERHVTWILTRGITATGTRTQLAHAHSGQVAGVMNAGA